MSDDGTPSSRRPARIEESSTHEGDDVGVVAGERDASERPDEGAGTMTGERVSAGANSDAGEEHRDATGNGSDGPPSGGAGHGDGGSSPPRGPRRWLLWIVSVIVVLTAGVAGGWRAQRHLTRSPEFCSSCHRDAAAAVHASQHGNTPCAGCHESRFGQNLGVWLLGKISKGGSTPHGKTDRATCKSCHTRGTFEPWHLASTNGHEEHVLRVNKPVECEQCHAWKEHRTEPKPEACENCHDDVEIFGAHALPDRAEKIPCLSCHNYLAKVAGGAHTPSNDCQRCHGGVRDPDRSTRFATTIAGKPISPDMIHGSLKTCSLCHTPHAPEPEARTSGRDCTRCHVKVSEEFHGQKDPKQFDCGTCHDVHSPRQELHSSCGKCHDAQRNPPQHTVAAAHEKCVECHQPHQFQATYTGCTGCHEKQQTLLASWDAKTHAECTNCHKPHAAQGEGATCASCHQLTAHRHAGCPTCHEPHGGKSATKACSECHGQQSVMLARGTTGHQRAGCTSCHQLHAFAGASKSCDRCHGKEVQLVSTAEKPRHDTCSSCHQPHAFGAGVEACTSCHAVAEQGAHTGPCTNCHQQHGPPRGKASACSNCHQNVGRPGGKHADCGSCHKAAHGPAVRPEGCRGCHGAQAKLVSVFANPTHRECRECHETHAPTAPRSCGSCHAKQALGVKTSRHQCESCHTTHTPERKPCASCHQVQAAAVRSRGATHSRCDNCHEPHQARKPPTCNTCHTELKAAHKMKGHDQCRTCHDTHDKPAPSRARCLSCHTTLGNHFPEAARCTSCHLFK